MEMNDGNGVSTDNMSSGGGVASGQIDAETTAASGESRGGDNLMSIVFQMLTSDDDSNADDDAVTTIGSPVTSPTPVSPVRPQSAWMIRKEERAGRTMRIDDIFAPTQPRPEELSDDEEDTFEPNEVVQVSQQTEIMLSPASQLHVLSQISEIAESRVAKEREATSINAKTRGVHRAHAWAPAPQNVQPPREQTTKRKHHTDSVSCSAARKTRKVKAKPSISANLAADILEWDAFDEPILLGDDMEAEAWGFEELSDSDF